MIDFSMLDDDALVIRARAAAEAERVAVVDMIGCLMEIQRRELHLREGFPNLFEYCVVRLRYSEGSAGRRLAGVRIAQRFPEVLGDLREGRLSLAVISRIEPFLGRSDARDILARACGMRRQALDEMLGSLPDQRPPLPCPEEEQPLPVLPLQSTPVAAPRTWSHPEPPRDPVSIALEAPPALREKLERLKGLLGFRLRTDRLEELVEWLADEALRRLRPAAKRRLAKRKTRRVPHAVRQEIWRRDGGCCAYQAPDGTRCTANRRLQYDHIRPWALGGPSDDPANIRLLCRAHNLLLARKLFPAARRATEAARAG